MYFVHNLFYLLTIFFYFLIKNKEKKKEKNLIKQIENYLKSIVRLKKILHVVNFIVKNC